MSDDDLVRRAIAGERDAFGELIQRYEKALLIFLHRKTKDRELALDLLQETFIDSLVALPSLRDPERFQSWLFTIARRKAWLAMRKARVQDEIFEPIPVVCSTPDEVLRAELSEVVRDAVKALPEKMRDVAQMHYLDEMPYSEVCRQLGIRVSTLKSRLHLARGQLREELTPFVEDMNEVRLFSERREVSMRLEKPEIRIEEVPGAEMEVDVVEPPNQYIKLEEAAKGEFAWFRNWANEENDHAYLIARHRVVGRAWVEGEECWEVQKEIRDPNGQLYSTGSWFFDRRHDGFYSFAGMSRKKGKVPEVYFSSPPVLPHFPIHLSLGMESSTRGRGMKVERVVDVQINHRTVRALETVWNSSPADPYWEPEGAKLLRLNRLYMGKDGRNVLFERYHSIEERASGDLPKDVPEIEHQGVEYLLYHYTLPVRLMVG